MLVLRQHLPDLTRAAGTRPASLRTRDGSGDARRCWRSPLALGLLLYAVGLVALLLAIG